MSKSGKIGARKAMEVEKKQKELLDKVLVLREAGYENRQIAQVLQIPESRVRALNKENGVI